MRSDDLKKTIQDLSPTFLSYYCTLRRLAWDTSTGIKPPKENGRMVISSQSSTIVPQRARHGEQSADR